MLNKYISNLRNENTTFLSKNGSIIQCLPCNGEANEASDFAVAVARWTTDPAFGIAFEAVLATVAVRR